MSIESDYVALRSLCWDIVIDAGPNIRDLDEWLKSHPLPEKGKRK